MLIGKRGKQLHVICNWSNWNYIVCNLASDSKVIFCRVLTMATQRSRGYLLANSVGCSPSSTPLLGLYSVPGSLITWRHYFVNSIGFGFRNGSPSSCRASSSDLSTAQHLCMLLTASSAHLTSPRGGESAFQLINDGRCSSDSLQHDRGLRFPGCCCPCMEQPIIVCHVVVVTVDF